MLKAYKYRIYPTEQQAVLIEKHFGCTRLVYNLALEMYKHHLKSGIFLSYFDIHHETKLLIREPEYDFLREVNRQSLYYSVKTLHRSFTNCFKHKYGFPKTKSKRSKQSYHATGGVRRIDFEKSLLSIGKIPNIKILAHRKFIGSIRKVTISKTKTNKYYASILVDTHTSAPEKPKIERKTTLGIDLGLKHFYTDSNGSKITNPRHLQNSLARLKVLQRRASKKRKGSSNRRKANLKVALLYEKIVNKRLDFLHKLTHELVNNQDNSTLVIENLSVQSMQQNSMLARAISDVGWSYFKSMLIYKCEWYGKNLILVDRYEPTSKRCSFCQHVKETLTLADRTYICDNCNSVIDRDLNAAINIKEYGLKLELCSSDSFEELDKHTGMSNSSELVEVSALVEPMKQESLLI